MGAHNAMDVLRRALNSPLVLAANTSLTVAQCLENGSIVINGAYAATLPAADAGLDGCLLLLAAQGAATVVVAAGFGGAGSGSDTCTLADGEFLLVWCDGSAWYALHNEPAA